MSWEGRDVPRDEDYDDGVIPRFLLNEDGSERDERWYEVLKKHEVPMKLAEAIINAPVLEEREINRITHMTDARKAGKQRAEVVRNRELAKSNLIAANMSY